MCRLKTTGYISASVHSRSVDHWITLITNQAEVTRRYALPLKLPSVLLTI